MQADEYRRMYELESHYWWFVARRRLALKLLRRALKGNQGPRDQGLEDQRVRGSEGQRIGGSQDRPANCSLPTADYPLVLDLGCGTGAVLSDLREFSRPVGLDLSPLALEFCQKRGLEDLLIGRGEALPLLDSSVDAVIGLDVFEHIEDDRLALREAARVLKPGGVLVLSVPAFKSLWGPHDVALMHFRRYRRSEVRRRLEEVGMRVEKSSYAIFLLFPAVASIRFFEKRRPGEPRASLPHLPRWLNRSLIGLQSFEGSLLSAANLPWGSSVVAVARKPYNKPRGSEAK